MIHEGVLEWGGANFAFSYLKPTRPYHSDYHYRAASDT